MTIYCQETIVIIVKHAKLLFGLEKNTNNIGSKNVMMKNKVIRDKSRSAICKTNK